MSAMTQQQCLVRLFDIAFPNINRREHWLSIYLAHREDGADHNTAVQRIEFERQHAPKEIIQKEIEALHDLEKCVRGFVQHKTCLAQIIERLDKIDAIRNPTPAGRWTIPNKTK